MSKTDAWIIVGVLTIALILAAGIYFSTRGPQDQSTASNQESTSSREPRASAPQSNTTASLGSARQDQTVSSTQSTDEKRPTALRQAEKNIKPTVSSGSQESLDQAAQPGMVSNPRKHSRATQTRRDATIHSKPKPGSGVVQPLSSSQSVVVPPGSSGEQRLQMPDSKTVATGVNPAPTIAALQPAPPSPASATVEPVATPFAMLRATGKMLLNGNLSDDSAIFSGESIETPPDTYATVMRENSEILIKPNSRLRITEAGVKLERGDVLVTTSNSLPVEANHLTIAPSVSSRTKYEVLETSESPEVKTYEGSVQVNE